MSTTDIFFVFCISPWGEVVSTTDEKESIVYADIDLEHLETIRKFY
jgi:predicted amidohydrolase